MSMPKAALQHVFTTTLMLLTEETKHKFLDVLTVLLQIIPLSTRGPFKYAPPFYLYLLRFYKNFCARLQIFFYDSQRQTYAIVTAIKPHILNDPSTITPLRILTFYQRPGAFIQSITVYSK